MRKIKFRVRNIKNGLVVGYEMLLEHGWVFKKGNSGWNSGVFELGAGFEREQYTGLKDKNGREIYEGDIIEWETSIGKKDRAVMEFERQAVMFDAGGSYFTKPFINSTSEVIGNIYENSELLGGEK